MNIYKCNECGILMNYPTSHTEVWSFEEIGNQIIPIKQEHQIDLCDKCSNEYIERIKERIKNETRTNY